MIILQKISGITHARFTHHRCIWRNACANSIGIFTLASRTSKQLGLTRVIENEVANTISCLQALVAVECPVNSEKDTALRVFELSMGEARKGALQQLTHFARGIFCDAIKFIRDEFKVDFVTVVKARENLKHRSAKGGVTGGICRKRWREIGVIGVTLPRVTCRRPYIKEITIIFSKNEEEKDIEPKGVQLAMPWVCLFPSSSPKRIPRIGRQNLFVHLSFHEVRPASTMARLRMQKSRAFSASELPSCMATVRATWL